MADSPDIRVGTVEREQAMQRLSDHFAAGRLSVAEFDERSAVIAAAVVRSDIDKVFTDLPEPVVEAPKPARPDDGGKAVWVERAMPVVVILAVILFFTTHAWLWFLAIPLAAAVFGGNRNRRRRSR